MRSEHFDNLRGQRSECESVEMARRVILDFDRRFNTCLFDALQQPNNANFKRFCNSLAFHVNEHDWVYVSEESFRSAIQLCFSNWSSEDRIIPNRFAYSSFQDDSNLVAIYGKFGQELRVANREPQSIPALRELFVTCEQLRHLDWLPSFFGGPVRRPIVSVFGLLHNSLNVKLLSLRCFSHFYEDGPNSLVLCAAAERPSSIWLTQPAFRDQSQQNEFQEFINSEHSQYVRIIESEFNGVHAPVNSLLNSELLATRVLDLGSNFASQFVRRKQLPQSIVHIVLREQYLSELEYIEELACIDETVKYSLDLLGHRRLFLDFSQQSSQLNVKLENIARQTLDLKLLFEESSSLALIRKFDNIRELEISFGRNDSTCENLRDVLYSIGSETIQYLTVKCVLAGEAEIKIVYEIDNFMDQKELCIQQLSFSSCLSLSMLVSWFLVKEIHIHRFGDNDYSELLREIMHTTVNTFVLAGEEGRIGVNLLAEVLDSCNRLDQLQILGLFSQLSEVVELASKSTAIRLCKTLVVGLPAAISSREVEEFAKLEFPLLGTFAISEKFVDSSVQDRLFELQDAKQFPSLHTVVSQRFSNQLISSFPRELQFHRLS